MRDTAVDLERAVEGIYNVGWMAPGEWLLYTVNVGTSGTYRLDLRVAANGSGGQLHVEFDGVNKTGALTIPNTGGWQAWTTISTQVTLGSGVQRMRVAVDSAGPTGVVGNLNFIDVTPLVSGPSTPQDLVLYTTDIPVTSLHGSWARASDDASPARIKLRTSDAGYAITSNPLAAPTHYLEATFTPVANTEYALWLRLKSKDNNKYNDSVWVQFSGARYQGAGVYPLNSTQGLLVNLATDAAASSLNGWGWANGAYWLAQPTTVIFPQGGMQTIRIQVREDGVELDQIVLSPKTYLTRAPGSPGGDGTFVPKP